MGGVIINNANIKIGDNFKIKCYKHDGRTHKIWDEAILLDIKKDYYVFGNRNTRVTESDGRSWCTKETAIMFYYKDRWFNVLGQFKSKGIFYYCNLASPAIISDGIIKYIDYDLDLRVFPDGGYKILDRVEYLQHKKEMQYSPEIDKILKFELKNLINLSKEKIGPFNEETIKHYNEIYCSFVNASA